MLNPNMFCCNNIGYPKHLENLDLVPRTNHEFLLDIVHEVIDLSFHTHILANPDDPLVRRLLAFKTIHIVEFRWDGGRGRR